jgi:hypothetical protein
MAFMVPALRLTNTSSFTRTVMKLSLDTRLGLHNIFRRYNNCSIGQVASRFPHSIKDMVKKFLAVFFSPL